MSVEGVKEVVKEKYGQAALRVAMGQGSACCGGGSALDISCDLITGQLYDPSEARELPPEALQVSLGCGNPAALAQLHPGEIVLDLGSGGGIDVLLSAENVPLPDNSVDVIISNCVINLSADKDRVCARRSVC